MKTYLALSLGKSKESKVRKNFIVFFKILQVHVNEFHMKFIKYFLKIIFINNIKLLFLKNCQQKISKFRTRNKFLPTEWNEKNCILYKNYIKEFLSWNYFFLDEKFSSVYWKTH